MERRDPNHYQVLKDSHRDAAETENSPQHPDVQHNRTDAAEQLTSQQKIAIVRAQYTEELNWGREKDAGHKVDSPPRSETTQGDAPLRPEDRKAAQGLSTFEINQHYHAREYAFERFGKRLGDLVATNQVEFDAAYEAYAQELDNHIKSGRGENRDRSYLLSRFSNDIRTPSNNAEQEVSPSNQRTDISQDGSDTPRRESSAEKKNKEKDHALTSRGEMTEAQQARYNRLMTRESFRETAHEVTDRNNDRNDHSGGRERGE